MIETIGTQLLSAQRDNMSQPWLPKTELLLSEWHTAPQLFKSGEMSLPDLVGHVKAHFSVEPILGPFLNVGDSILFRNLIHKALVNHPGRIGRLIDFGCGSSLPTISAILGVVEENRPAQVWAVDVNDDAIAASKHNVSAAGLESVYCIDKKDMLSVFSENTSDLSVDLIVANPPYVPSPDKLQSEFLIPVNGGADGLRFLRPILQMPLKPGTRVAIVAGSLSSPAKLAELINESFNVISCDSYIVPFLYSRAEPIYSYLKSLRQQESIDCFLLEDGQDAFITFTLLLEKKS
jgi:precorrin-6B methylase 2